MLKHLVWGPVIFAVAAHAAERVFELDESRVNHLPAGFRSALCGQGQPGDWKIVLDEVPPALAPLTDRAPSVSRRPVLAQLNADKTDERFPLLIFDGDTYGDFALTTRFKLVSGETERMAGIAFRIQNETNFYVVRASGLGNNLRFYKVVNGERSPPLGPQVPVPSGQWHELRIECQANQIRAFLNGQPALPTLNDNTFVRGKIGFWTKSDSVSYFADTRIVYRPRVPFAQTLLANALEKYSRVIDLKLSTLDTNGVSRVIAGKNPADVGLPGEAADTKAIAEGQLFFGRGKGTVTVVLPLRDRNGEPMAAVRVVMDSFPGQTENNAIVRATPIVKEMQRNVRSLEELLD